MTTQEALVKGARKQGEKKSEKKELDIKGSIYYIRQHFDGGKGIITDVKHLWDICYRVNYWKEVEGIGLVSAGSKFLHVEKVADGFVAKEIK